MFRKKILLSEKSKLQFEKSSSFSAWGPLPDYKEKYFETREREIELLEQVKKLKKQVALLESTNIVPK